MVGVLSSVGTGSSLGGWAIFLAYLLAAWFCLLNARASVTTGAAGVRQLSQGRSRRRVWTAMGVLLLLLGISRQFGLQAMAASVMRSLLLVDEVYGERRGLQIGLIAAIASFGGVALLIALVSFRRADRSVRVALVAAGLLTGYTIVRATSLHDLDHLFALALLPHLTINHLVELALLSILVLACFTFSRGLKSEKESARLRALSIGERRRMMSEKRRAGRS